MFDSFFVIMFIGIFFGVLEIIYSFFESSPVLAFSLRMVGVALVGWCIFWVYESKSF